MSRDYQWPEPNFKKSLFSLHTSKGQQAEIESFFEEIYGVSCFLFPSARAALSAILRYKNINRSHSLYAPKWLSHCVWDTLSRYGNPTVTPSIDVDVNLCVHKWGYAVETDLTNALVINDSVDSIFTSGDELLKGADFEIVSLPKTIGAIAGGLLVTKDPDFRSFFQSLKQSSNPQLAQSQEATKVDVINGKSVLYSWEEHDWNNFIVLECTLNSVSQCIAGFQKTISTVKERLYLANELIELNYLDLSASRLPCLIPIKCPYNVSISNNILKRKFNFSFHNERGDFDNALLLPIHIGISDDEFLYFRNEIHKAL
jgi:putative PLP-dependent aminotransferase (TIGR04422 family)